MNFVYITWYNNTNVFSCWSGIVLYSFAYFFYYVCLVVTFFSLYILILVQKSKVPFLILLSITPALYILLISLLYYQSPFVDMSDCDKRGTLEQILMTTNLISVIGSLVFAFLKRKSDLHKNYYILTFIFVSVLSILSFIYLFNLVD